MAYVPGNVVTLEAGRWDVGAESFLTGQGDVTQADFYVVAWADLFAVEEFDAAPWQHIGAGTFDTVSDMWWKCEWNTTAYEGDGYALQVIFQDSLGELTGVNNTTYVPEPTTLSLLAFCLVGLALYVHRRTM